MTVPESSAFDEAHAYVTDRGGFLSAAFQNALRIAVCQFTAEQRRRLVKRGDGLFYLGRNDFAFTVHRQQVPSRFCVVVLQQDLFGSGSNATSTIHDVLLGQTQDIDELPAPCLLDDQRIEAGRFLPQEHQHLVRTLFDEMHPKGKSWLARRGRSIVIIGDVKAAYGVPLLDVPSPSDLVIMNGIGLALPERHALGLLGHELGHVARRDAEGTPTPQTKEGEIEADAYASSWGFGDGLREHLSDEIDTTTDVGRRTQLEARVKALG